TVTIPGLDFSAPFTVLANQGTRVRLPYEAMTLLSDQVDNRGIHITSQAPVTVYGLNYTPGSADSFLALPVSVLGTTYIVNGYHNGAGFSVKGSEFGLVATLDNTRVTLTLPINQGSRLANVPYEITLNRGQVYQLTRTEANDTLDLSGSIITSDKPIAVFGGHICTGVPANGFCDHLVEQLPSIDKWGRHFVTVPLATRPNGDIFRFVASLDDTHIAINGTQAVTLNRGQIHERLITGAAQILADKPILVVQYATGSSYGSTLSSTYPDPADPFMMVITPYTRFTNHYIVTNPQAINLSFGGLHTHFLNIAAPVAAVGNISLDGVLIPASSFTAIGSSGYFGAQIQVAPGKHALIGSQPFGVYAYGWGFVVSYGHSGGMSFGSEVCEESLELSQLERNRVSPPCCGTPKINLWPIPPLPSISSEPIPKQRASRRMPAGKPGSATQER
ncbi:MAG TPA: IgGFc-binding protein, partial [Acidobacteriota bacterium]|nr:IgGFc-binding protein [Acidobacteriota bacterium]